jgi:hypothetical protein
MGSVLVTHVHIMTDAPTMAARVAARSLCFVVLGCALLCSNRFACDDGVSETHTNPTHPPWSYSWLHALNTQHPFVPPLTAHHQCPPPTAHRPPPTATTIARSSQVCSVEMGDLSKMPGVLHMAAGARTAALFQAIRREVEASGSRQRMIAEAEKESALRRLNSVPPSAGAALLVGCMPPPRLRTL